MAHHSPISGDRGDTFAAQFCIIRALRLMEGAPEDAWHGCTRDQLVAVLEEFNVALGWSLDDTASLEAYHEALMGRMKDLATMPYAQYLRSPEWALVRSFALRRAGERCQACNGSGRLQVHHRTYARRGYEWLDDVTVLCGDCHQVFHDHRRLTR